MRHDKTMHRLEYIADCLDHLREEARAAGLGEVAMLIELALTAAFDAAGARLPAGIGRTAGPAAHPL